MEQGQNTLLPWNEQQEAARDAAIRTFASSLDPSDPFVVMFRDAVLPMAISDPTLTDNPVIYANDAFEKLTGYPREEVLGRNCRFLQGPLTNGAHVERLRDAIERRSRIELDLLNHRKDGTAFWNRLLVAPVFDAYGGVRYFIASQHDVTLERDRLSRLEAEQEDLKAAADRSQAELVASSLKLDLALRAGKLGAWSFDPVSERLDATAGCKVVFGRSPNDVFGYREFLDTVHPEDRDRVLAAIEATISEGAEYDIEYRIVLPSGETRWVAIRGELITRRDGSPLSMTGYSTDITVNQTLRDAASMSEARDAIGGRIASLAVAHDLLLRDEVEGASIGDIVAGVMAPFDDGAGRLFSVNGPDVRLEPRVTLALSMALHELATNASKYGALSMAGGHVTILWEVGIGDQGRQLSFIWREGGGPPVTPPDKIGFGSRMIERVLAQHMRGAAAVDYRPEGLVFSIKAPL